MLRRIPPPPQSINPIQVPSPTNSVNNGQAEASSEDEQGKHKQITVRHILNTNTPLSSMAYADDDFRCPNCRRVFRARFHFNRHIAKCQRRLTVVERLPVLPPQGHNHIRSEIYESALRGCCQSIRFTRTAEAGAMLPHEFFAAARPLIDSWLIKLQQHANEYKVQPVLRVKAVKVNAEGEVTHCEKQIFSLSALTMTEGDIDSVVADLLRKVEAYVRNGSNWIIDDVDYFDLRITKFYSAPNVRGHGVFPLPQRLAQKQAVVNVDNQGGSACFKCAIL